MGRPTNPSGFDGTQGQQQRYASNPLVINTSSGTTATAYIFRAIAIFLTFISAIVMGAARQTVRVTVDDVTGDEVLVPVTAKSTAYSSFGYFIAVNALTFFYSIAALVATLASRVAPQNLELLVITGDLVITALLFSCGGAAAAFYVLANDENSNAGWGDFCDAFGRFCGQVVGSVVLSGIASFLYLMIVLITVIIIRKRTL